MAIRKGGELHKKPNCSDVQVASNASVEVVRVRILPDERLSAPDAAAYVGLTVKTMASWRSQGIGPVWTKVGGRIFYFKVDLDAFIAGKSSRSAKKGGAVTPLPAQRVTSKERTNGR